MKERRETVRKALNLTPSPCFADAPSDMALWLLVPISLLLSFVIPRRYLRLSAVATGIIGGLAALAAAALLAPALAVALPLCSAAAFGTFAAFRQRDPRVAGPSAGVVVAVAYPVFTAGFLVALYFALTR